MSLNPTLSQPATIINIASRPPINQVKERYRFIVVSLLRALEKSRNRGPNRRFSRLRRGIDLITKWHNVGKLYEKISRAVLRSKSETRLMECGESRRFCMAH